ncbi:MAG TPA: GNAT family N-acetyltransferase, partial [Acidimicrobiales bacterium]|nr:GNAT family N-acetyltransferase [Acidimicrobiales bacterium]
MTTLPPSTSPAGWDVVLTDGSTARVRPVSPADIAEIKALHARLSKETVRLRYFGAHPRLPEDELARLVEEEGPDHLTLVAERGGQLVGIAQYDRIPGSDVAEVAFVIDDAHQGFGIGTLLLEYL